MTSTLLALALAVTDPNGFPAVVALPTPSPAMAIAVAPPAPSALALASPASGTTGGGPTLALPASPGGIGPLALPAAALALLGAVAAFLARRRRPTHRLVQVLETTSLGPKRSLVVARLGDEILVLGVSEAGLQLLAARPASGEARSEPVTRLRPVPSAEPEPEDQPRPAGPGVVASLLGRLRPRAKAPRESPAFDALLSESAEDQELRRKLARGLSGSVR
jgi:flagellar protein FliO/FliZ